MTGPIRHRRQQGRPFARWSDTQIRLTVAGFVGGCLAGLFVPWVRDTVLTIVVGGFLAAGSVIGR